MSTSGIPQAQTKISYQEDRVNKATLTIHASSTVFSCSEDDKFRLSFKNCSISKLIKEALLIMLTKERLPSFFKTGRTENFLAINFSTRSTISLLNKKIGFPFVQSSKINSLFKLWEQHIRAALYKLKNFK
uniref:Uncharacterized protein n=1 Tax=Romanomermis culicivorax TaxID=13658 RepID=A0A915HM55_ROMCU